MFVCFWKICYTAIFIILFAFVPIEVSASSGSSKDVTQSLNQDSNKEAASVPKNYELISNESTNGTKSENSDSIQINNDQYTFNKHIAKNAYEMDYVKPFDEEKYKNQLLSENAKSIKQSYDVGDHKQFWTYNIAKDQYESMNATLLYDGSRTQVWVNDNEISATEAKQLGSEFDDHIYPLDVENFGNESDVDGNKKVNILVYDIQDGFSGDGGYVAGYFDPRDLSTASYSNRSEIFYIDTYPSMGLGSSKDVSEAYSTLAHEFQHMINYNQKVLIQQKPEMDTWLNEGLSMAAEQMYLKQSLQDRIDYYNEDADITKGHSLLNWDDSGDTLANYSLSYLFIEYLKIQCGHGDQIFKELIDDSNSNYQAVQDIIKKYIDKNLTFGKFMTDFRAALILRQRSGLYGFKGDPAFDSLQTKVYSGGALNLKGGGAVVKQIPSSQSLSIPVNKGTDITYTLLSTDQSSAQPIKPNVQEIGDNSNFIIGTAYENNKVFVKSGSKVIGQATVDSHDMFKVQPIPKQKAGSILTIYAENSLQQKSAAVSVKVVDKTPPAVPSVYTFGNNAITITGKAEQGSSVFIKSGKTVLGHGIASNKGSFSIKIKAKQKAGTVLTVYAVDKAGNKSASKTIKVVDKISPATPKVYTFGNNSTTVTGKTEAGATLTIYRGKIVLGKGVANSKGNVSVKIKSKQKAGTVLVAYATDKVGNRSHSKSFKVADKIAPHMPSVNKVTTKTTKVTGKAEKSATVYVYRGSKYLGKAKSSSKGYYHIKISKQKKGATLKIYAKDKAGNKSKTRSVKVY